jgi:hypothetical protein
MPVFADADESDIDLPRGERHADFARGRHRIIVSVQQVIAAHRDFFDEAIEKVPPETRRMRDRKPNIFVEVKHLDARPVYAGARRQGLEEVDLRRASRDNDARRAVRFDAIPQGTSRMRGGRPAERGAIRVDRDAHYGSANTNSDNPAAAAMYCLPLTA